MRAISGTSGGSGQSATSLGQLGLNQLGDGALEREPCDRSDRDGLHEKRPLGICVRNLPVRSTDTSLKDGLFHEYKKHGKVTVVKVIGQGTDRYAVVCFKKPEDVEKALEVSKDKLFFGCKIEVKAHEGLDGEDNEFRPLEAELDEYHPKATRTLFIGNLEKDITTSELRKHFEGFGEIIEIDIKKQGSASSYAFIQYSDIASVVKAMRKLDGENLGANRIKLGFGKSMPTMCVWLDGIADTVNEKFLARQFSRYGPVTYSVIDRERGHALVYFDSLDCAQHAVSEMRGRALNGKRLQVDFASRECQSTFFERIESSGQIAQGDRPWISRGGRVAPVLPPDYDRERNNLRTEQFEQQSRYSRYDAPARSRSASNSTFRAVGTRATSTAANPPATNRAARTSFSSTPRYDSYHDDFERRNHRFSEKEDSLDEVVLYEDRIEPEWRTSGSKASKIHRNSMSDHEDSHHSGGSPVRHHSRSPPVVKKKRHRKTSGGSSRMSSPVEMDVTPVGLTATGECNQHNVHKVVDGQRRRSDPVFTDASSPSQLERKRRLLGVAAAPCEEADSSEHRRNKYLNMKHDILSSSDSESGSVSDVRLKKRLHHSSSISSVVSQTQSASSNVTRTPTSHTSSKQNRPHQVTKEIPSNAIKKHASAPLKEGNVENGLRGHPSCNDTVARRDPRQARLWASGGSIESLPRSTASLGKQQHHKRSTDGEEDAATENRVAEANLCGGQLTTSGPPSKRPVMVLPLPRFAFSYSRSPSPSNHHLSHHYDSSQSALTKQASGASLNAVAAGGTPQTAPASAAGGHTGLSDSECSSPSLGHGSAHFHSHGHGITTRPSIEERIKAFDEKWSSSTSSATSATSTPAANVQRSFSTTQTENPQPPPIVIDYQKYTIKKRPRFPALAPASDIVNKTEPSEITKSLLAKQSILDQDSKRLEHINEKYEPNKDVLPLASIVDSKELLAAVKKEPDSREQPTVAAAVALNVVQSPVAPITPTSASLGLKAEPQLPPANVVMNPVTTPGLTSSTPQQSQKPVLPFRTKAAAKEFSMPNLPPMGAQNQSLFPFGTGSGNPATPTAQVTPPVSSPGPPSVGLKIESTIKKERSASPPAPQPQTNSPQCGGTPQSGMMSPKGASLPQPSQQQQPLAVVERLQQNVKKEHRPSQGATSPPLSISRKDKEDKAIKKEKDSSKEDNKSISKKDRDLAKEFGKAKSPKATSKKEQPSDTEMNANATSGNAVQVVKRRVSSLDSNESESAKSTRSSECGREKSCEPEPKRPKLSSSSSGKSSSVEGEYKSVGRKEDTRKERQDKQDSKDSREKDKQKDKEKSGKDKDREHSSKHSSSTSSSSALSSHTSLKEDSTQKKDNIGRKDHHSSSGGGGSSSSSMKEKLDKVDPAKKAKESKPKDSNKYSSSSSSSKDKRSDDRVEKKDKEQKSDRDRHKDKDRSRRQEKEHTRQDSSSKEKDRERRDKDNVSSSKDKERKELDRESKEKIIASSKEKLRAVIDKEKMDKEKDKSDKERSEKCDKGSSKSDREGTSSWEEKAMQRQAIAKEVADAAAAAGIPMEELGFVDGIPMFLSMYDKVKQRSCKNQQQQQPVHDVCKGDKFSKLKQSRARKKTLDSDASDDFLPTDASNSENESRQRKNRKNSLSHSHSKKRKTVIESSSDGEASTMPKSTSSASATAMKAPSLSKNRTRQTSSAAKTAVASESEDSSDDSTKLSTIFPKKAEPKKMDLSDLYSSDSAEDSDKLAQKRKKTTTATVPKNLFDSSEVSNDSSAKKDSLQSKVKVRRKPEKSILSDSESSEDEAKKQEHKQKPREKEQPQSLLLHSNNKEPSANVTVSSVKEEPTVERVKDGKERKDKDVSSRKEKDVREHKEHSSEYKDDPNRLAKKKKLKKVKFRFVAFSAVIHIFYWDSDS